MTEEQKTAQEEIEKKTDKAMKLIREAEKLADANNVEFDFYIAYGMGGGYLPKHEDGDTNWDGDQGWCASSNSC